MILISSLIPIDQIITKEDITSQDWFLLQTNIKTKSLSDPKMQLIYDRLYLYSFWYTEKLHLYLMTDNYYYKSYIHTLLPKTYGIIIQKKIPKYINHPDYIKQYPILKERTVSESSIQNALELLFHNNFKENPIIHTILGGIKHE